MSCFELIARAFAALAGGLALVLVGLACLVASLVCAVLAVRFLPRFAASLIKPRRVSLLS